MGGGGGSIARGGKGPGRIRMELTVPKGGALGRGNLPPDSPSGMPAMPDTPELPAVPDGAAEAPLS